MGYVEGFLENVFWENLLCFEALPNIALPYTGTASHKHCLIQALPYSGTAFYAGTFMHEITYASTEFFLADTLKPLFQHVSLRDLPGQR